MVADDEVDTQLLRISYFIDCLDTAIEHDNQFHTVLSSIVYSLLAHTISLLVAVGNVVFHIGIELL